MSAAAPILRVMALAKRCVKVTIVGQPTREQELTASQAEGRACFGCGTSGAELVPVGVMFPPSAGHGVVRACPECAPEVLST